MSKKRKRKPSEINFAPKKKLKDEGVNFFALLAGLVSSFLIIFMLGSWFTNSIETARDLEAARKDSSGNGSLGEESFEKTLESGTAEQLADLLDERKEANGELSVHEHIRAARRTIRIADRMLTKNLAEAQRSNAIESKIESLSKIYFLNFTNEQLREPSVVDSLRSAAKPHVDDANESIARTARLSLFRMESLELTRRDDHGDVKPIAKQMVGLIGDFSDDKVFMEKLALIVSVLSAHSAKLGRDLVAELLKDKDKIESQNGRDLLDELADKQILVETEFEQIFHTRRTNGETGQRALSEISMQLVSKPEAGTYLLSTVDDRVQWFEKNDQFELAEPVYKKMLESADSLISPEAAVVARKLAQNGLTRIAAVGQPFDLSGVYLDGPEINAQDFKDKIVVVLFWSIKNDESIQAIERLHGDAQKLAKKPVRLLAVCIDQELDAKFLTQVKKIASENDRLMYVDGRKSNPIFDQCPSSKTPRVMLVDKKGVVRSTNLPVEETETELNLLLSD